MSRQSHATSSNELLLPSCRMLPPAIPAGSFNLSSKRAVTQVELPRTERNSRRRVISERALDASRSGAGRREAGTGRMMRTWCGRSLTRATRRARAAGEGRGGSYVYRGCSVGTVAVRVTSEIVRPTDIPRRLGGAGRQSAYAVCVLG